jgi:FkbM family methyltransferase
MLLPEHRAARREWTTGWEVERLAYMRLHLRPGMLVYDVGAEEGDMSALYAQWTGVGPVLFEPNDRVWPNIKAIWEANGLPRPTATWVGFAAQEDRGSAMWTGGAWPACAEGPVIGDHGFQSLVESRASLPCLRIDTMAEITQRPPDAITMDVEGAELEVLRGAEHVLLRHRPLVWVSIHPSFMAVDYPTKPGATGDDCREAVLEYMRSLAYKPRLLAVDHEEHWQFLPGDLA